MSHSTLPADHLQRMARLAVALDGLSVGDALGQQFMVPGIYFEYFRRREVPTGPWRYTDDTEMALAIAAVLCEHGKIVQDELAGQRSQKSPLPTTFPKFSLTERPKPAPINIWAFL